jgi:hypothetical protein
MAMRRPAISKFPLDRPFERQEARTPLSELALRLVVNFYSDAPFVVGTATVLCGHLLVTAKHVFSDILENYSILHNQQGTTLDKHIVAVQLIPGPTTTEYVLWDVANATLDPASDIALIHLAPNPARSHHNNSVQWRQPTIAAFPPEIGETVAAFGYRHSKIQVSKNADGGNHIDLNDEPMVSVGLVREIYDWGRDSVFLPFPCYRVGARFDAGMSGGPVFDEAGALCGIVCSNFVGSDLDGEPVSYVSTLWPLFRLTLSGDRGDGYPRGVKYPAIELARGGQVRVVDFQRLDRWFAEMARIRTASDTDTNGL